MKPSFNVVIPARYDSSRLPGKPLRLLAGKPMVLHVCDRALEAGAEEIIVATDDQRIFDTVESAGMQAVMTRSDHENGSERIAEVARICGWEATKIVINLQGDEPLIPASAIQQVALGIDLETGVEVATLAAPICNLRDLFNPNIVKVVLNCRGIAMYFSRAAIPWDRDQFSEGPAAPSLRGEYLRHIGMYAYAVGFLRRYAEWKPTPLESIELLEQLRILWYGEPLKVNIIEQALESGVDIEDDLKRVERILNTRLQGHAKA